MEKNVYPGFITLISNLYIFKLLYFDLQYKYCNIQHYKELITLCGNEVQPQIKKYIYFV